MSRRRWTKKQLIRNLEILGTLEAPLPPTLPPSPPASRPSSPALGHKRKSETPAIVEHPKRPRIESSSSKPTAIAALPPSTHRGQASSSSSSSSRPPIPPSAPYSSRPDFEDGEVREDSASSSSSSIPVAPNTNVSSAVPVRRPKRGVPSVRYYESLHDGYYGHGRKLKYSGDARFWSSYPPTHKDYQPLLDPPPPNSPYHKYSGLIARLELVDALVCFTYALWNRDYSRRVCNIENWGTIEGFLSWCKLKWEAAGKVVDEAERAFIGLIWMIEAFVHARKVTYSSKNFIDPTVERIVGQTRRDLAAAVAGVESRFGSDSDNLNVKSRVTPQMLPSPASIAPANSANSTPNNRDGGTPSTSGSSASETSPPNNGQPVPDVSRRLVPQRFLNTGLPIPHYVSVEANKITQPIDTVFIGGLKDLTSGIGHAAHSITTAQQMLTLPIMARHFPRTFARMMYSSLTLAEEHEPEFEDEEGELLWPGQCVNGEGLGWLCVMGQAMIREFGKRYGYRGVAGVVPKPPQHGANGGSTPNERLPQPLHEPSPSSSSRPTHSLPPRPAFSQHQNGSSVSGQR